MAATTTAKIDADQIEVNVGIAIIEAMQALERAQTGLVQLQRQNSRQLAAVCRAKEAVRKAQRWGQSKNKSV